MAALRILRRGRGSAWPRLLHHQGKPRRFCSTVYRQTRNSRVSAPQRAATARKLARQGRWHSGLEDLTDEEHRRNAQKGGAIRGEQIKAEIAAGTWTHPSEYPGVREKLSQPRKHADNPDLHGACEKLRQGAHMADLPEPGADAMRAYWRARRHADPACYSRCQRKSRQRRMATKEGRAQQRAQWRQAKRRQRQHSQNQLLRRLRQEARLSQADLAEAVGVRPETVSRRERYGVTPRDPAIRSEVTDLLGAFPWPADRDGAD